MAISLVGTASGASVNGGNVTITLPASLQNDIVVVIGGNGDHGTDAAVTTSGYTSLASDSKSDTNANASYKRMGVSPDASVTCNGGGDTDDGVAYVAMVFRGVDTSTAIDATTTSATGSSDPNSPAIVTVTNGAAVITGFLCETQIITTLNAPTGYGDKISNNASDVNAVTAGAAWKTVSPAASENPGSWDTSVSPTADWVAFTIALRPASAGTFGDGALSGTGTANVSFGAMFTQAAGFAATATVTVAWEGNSLTSNPAPFTMPGTATVSFVGLAASFGDFTMAGGVTVTWIGDKEYMSSVREVIESAGAVSVTVH